jgi:hypothetical protein
MNLTNEYIKLDIFQIRLKKLLSFLEDKKIVLYGEDKDFERITSIVDLSELKILGAYNPERETKIDFKYGYRFLNRSMLENFIKPDVILNIQLDGLYRGNPFDNINPIRLSIFSDIDKCQIYYMETHLTNHCNLKCKYCTHFSSISKEWYLNLEEFEKDINCLSEKVDVYQLILLGGEPLLHKNIIDFLRISRIYFPISRIKILTNGILLPAMTEEFWQSCVSNNIEISLSLYPALKDKWDDYTSLLEKYGLTGEVFLRDYFHNLSLSSTPINDKEFSFSSCETERCTTLKDGKLYVCEADAYLNDFNEYFGKNLPQSKGIDIYSKSSKEIDKELKQGCELCKYCDVKKRYEKLQKWDFSKREITEWLVD